MQEVEKIYLLSISIGEVSVLYGEPILPKLKEKLFILK